MRVQLNYNSFKRSSNIESNMMSIFPYYALVGFPYSECSTTLYSRFRSRSYPVGIDYGGG